MSTLQPYFARLFVALAWLSFASAVALAQEAPRMVTADEARKHVGSVVTVCDSVASATYVSRSNGRPTFLNLGRAYPNQIFTVVIWGEVRDQFPEPPERAFRNRRICVTGRVTTYRGAPQIVVREPSAVRLQRQERRSSSR